MLYGREGLAENLPTSKPLTQTELGILSARILAEILKFIEQSSQESRIVVVLDGLDVLLATGYVTLDELEQLIGTITEVSINYFFFSFFYHSFSLEQQLQKKKWEKSHILMNLKIA